MAEIELKLLKEKLDSLLDKGFITRVLLLGVDQLCLCQKKDGTQRLYVITTHSMR
jgi:hypothetical protein